MKPLKKLEELGLPQSPWKYVGYHDHKHDLHLGEVRVEGGRRKLVTDIPQHEAQIMSAAPDMYDALWDLLFGKTGYCNVCKGHELGNCKECDYGKAMAALEKAGGAK